jgi:lipoprotein-anchoring transpeptidase ErfK/SrfK
LSGALAPLAQAMTLTWTIASAAQADPRACAQIRAACEQAGFVQGAARQGVGLYAHCVAPIMQSSPQPVAARLPLPRVDPRQVADCRASHPQFGQPRPQPPEAVAGLAPVAPPLAPALAPPPASVAPPAPVTSAPGGGPSGGFDNRGQVALPPPPDAALRPPRSTTEQFSALPPEDRPETGPAKALPPQFRRTMIDYRTSEPAGTLIVDTQHTYLYLVLGDGKAMRYGIGVGREGFTWTGSERVSKMAEWPDWHPPAEMIERQPYLPRFMAGGEGNPLGARALYLGQTLYRIHGTNQPSTIGSFVSSGCIRLTNDDITDLYGRVHVGTRVVVLPGAAPHGAQATAQTPAQTPRPEPAPEGQPTARAR